MKQQATLLSFFGKGKATKRPARDDATAVAAGGSGGSSSSSPSRPRARKQAKPASAPSLALHAVVDPALPNGASEHPVNDADDPSASSNECGSAEEASHNNLTPKGSDGSNKGAGAKAISPPSPATDTTEAVEESDSEDESDNESDDESTASSESNSSAHQGKSDNTDTSGANTTNADGKSAYELLREKNIARNNARLRALGLLAGVEAQTTSSQRRSNGSGRKRQAKSAAHDASSLPTRRSSRLRKPAGTNELGAPPSYEESVARKVLLLEAESKETAEAAEEFTVSPLIEYQMTNSDGGRASAKSNDATTYGHKGNAAGDQIKTLVPRGPRLVPPSGLNAIYSLQFHPSRWENDTDGSGSNSNDSSWLVGAGKAGLIALWDCSKQSHAPEEEEEYIEPVISWKGHGGRWIADARFLPPAQSSVNDGSAGESAAVPSRLLTAANDGTVCHWDLTSTSVQTGVPKLLDRSGKGLHASGIFSMDVRIHGSGSGAYIVTGSKDKTLAVATLDRLDPLWRSDFHSAKVGSVCFSSSRVNPLIASASDDGLVAIHDARLDGTKGSNNGNGVVAQLEDVHFKPHSAVWRPGSDSIFMTAGLDEVVKLWDLRNTSSPIASYHGHVPGNGKRLKRIHRPAFFNAASESYILSGGEGSHAISMFKVGTSNERVEGLQPVFSRGRLPEDVGDVGSLAVTGKSVAVAAEGGEVLMLSPED